METDRRMILRLVALGRISPMEAERLLIAWNDGRETIWTLAACIAAALFAQPHWQAMLPGLTHVAHYLLPVDSTSVQHLLSLLTHLLGGVL